MIVIEVQRRQIEQARQRTNRHDPILAEAELVSTMSATTGQLYVSRTAIWNRKLLNYRTALMVMMRAVLMGRDPAQEYHRFVNAGGKYFLDYPVLCP